MKNQDNQSSLRLNEAAELICHELQKRERGEVIYVVTKNPLKLEILTKRRWSKKIRQIIKQRSNPRDVTSLIELSTRIALMESVIFACAPPVDLLQADIIFLAHEDQTNLPKEAKIMAC